MKKLAILITELEAALKQADVKNETISAANIGWHVEHSLMVIIQVIAVLKESDPTDFRWAFHASRTLIYFTGVIPRGKAKAPSRVQPKEEIGIKKMQLHCKVAQTLVGEMALLNKNCFIKHPFLGYLNVPMATRFLNIHTRHHVKIIEDIVRQTAR